jgi:hypothetical protein
MDSAVQQVQRDLAVRRVYREARSIERWKMLGHVIFSMIAIVGPVVLWSVILSPFIPNDWVSLGAWILIIVTSVSLFRLRRVMIQRVVARRQARQPVGHDGIGVE